MAQLRMREAGQLRLARKSGGNDLPEEPRMAVAECTPILDAKQVQGEWNGYSLGIFGFATVLSRLLLPSPICFSTYLP